MHPKQSGNSGRYFVVRNWLSEKGLSSAAMVANSVAAAITVSPPDPGSDAQQRRHFFLNANDDLRFSEFFRQLA